MTSILPDWMKAFSTHDVCIAMLGAILGIMFYALVDLLSSHEGRRPIFFALFFFGLFLALRLWLKGDF